MLPLLADDAAELRRALQALYKGSAGLHAANVKHMGFRREFILEKLFAAHPALAAEARLHVWHGHGCHWIGRRMDMDVCLQQIQQGFQPPFAAAAAARPGLDLLFVGSTWRTSLSTDMGALVVNESRDVYYVLVGALLGQALDTAYRACGSNIDAGVRKLDSRVLADLQKAMRATSNGSVWPPAETLVPVSAAAAARPRASRGASPRPALVVATGFTEGVAELKAMLAGEWFRSADRVTAIPDARRSVPALVRPMASLGTDLLRLAAGALPLGDTTLGPGDRSVLEAVLERAASAVDAETQRLTPLVPPHVTKDDVVAHFLSTHRHDLLEIHNLNDTVGECAANAYMTALDDPSGRGDVRACLACRHRANMHKLAEAAERAVMDGPMM